MTPIPILSFRDFGVAVTLALVLVALVAGAVLAIARLLLKNPAIIILDEATSHLDNDNEAHIQSALEHAMEGRTALVIAHRLSTIRSADRIAFVEDGRIAEIGTHDELLASNGRYAHQIQAGELVTPS